MAKKNDKLTFGELEQGDKFIGFPMAGDDDGHGGYKGGHYLYVKVRDDNSETMAGSNAIAIDSGTPSKFNDRMEVIKII